MKNNNLWSGNTPSQFWMVQEEVSEEVWDRACEQSIYLLKDSVTKQDQDIDIDDLLLTTLGEGRYGANHWQLSLAKRAYYQVKPVLPRFLTLRMRQLYSHHEGYPHWPVDDRYVCFLEECLHQVMILQGKNELHIRSLWPDQNRYALVLTHDIETAEGQEFVEQVADLEESLGFRSSFNFVPERYKVDTRLMDSLRRRGFEIGVHSLNHDGKLFSSRSVFERRVQKINQYLKDWDAKGFRADLTHRQPEWMQMLEVEYDLSFFDTDPFEPIPGGTMSIWPFFIGHLIELPYTLVQDYSLISVLQQTSATLWFDKLEFIKNHHGMALLNSHPDYLKDQETYKVYAEFLQGAKKNKRVWQALPRDVARWWRKRATSDSDEGPKDTFTSMVVLNNGELLID